MYGYFGNTTGILNAWNNCWEPSGPNNYVWNTNGNPYNPNVTIITSTTPSYQCRIITPTSYDVYDMGNGIYDTVWTSESDAMPNSIGDDVILYGQGEEYMTSLSYLDAISTFKTLIDNHNESNLLQDAMLDMYACHESLDTFTTQYDRSILYGSLKTYLENMINSEEYDIKINETAYEIILMCAGNMGEFDEAVTGYEFLALYHPDPDTRLMSSEDLLIVEDLMEGEGSGANNLSLEEAFRKIKRKIDKLLSGDPILRKVKQSYDKIREENSKKLKKDLQIRFGKDNADLKLQKITEIVKRFDNRVRENLSIMRTLSKEQKEQRNFETMLMIASSERYGMENDNQGSSTPFSYKLEQNYPNPFNPATIISYSVPNDLIVKIKVYDITGREIKILVNELKTAGQYSVSFNGNSLASGVYFYKIEAGSFVQTKRMVLVK